jgi:hypothetical protein
LGTLLKNQIGKMENRVDELADDLFLSIPAQDLIDDISQDAYLQALAKESRTSSFGMETGTCSSRNARSGTGKISSSKQSTSYLGT